MLRSSDCWDSKTHRQIVDYSSRWLWRFIQSNAKETSVEEVMLKLTGLKRRELNMLADIHFLLSDEVKYLLNEVAPKIINRLSKESINEHILDRNNVRGRINWHRTISARAAAGNDKTLFVYTRRAQIFDLPENRLFLYIVKYINEKARNFVIEDYLNLTWYDEVENYEKWLDKIKVIASKTTFILRNPIISRIGNLPELSIKIIELTKKCRNSIYKELANIAERLAYRQNTPVLFLKEELKGNILEPLNKDTLYEIAVLFKTLQTALECGWKEERVGLIGGSSKSISKLTKGNLKLRLYYQRMPSNMASISKYGDIMTDYGLSEKLRRPDIILEFSNGQKKNYVIVEVKRSQKRDYLVDGTYKLLGYLKDFELLNNDNSKISGFLVGWSNIKSEKLFAHEKEVHLYSWDNYHNGLLKLLQSMEMCVNQE
jgi:hypothetical protein